MSKNAIKVIGVFGVLSVLAVGAYFATPAVKAIASDEGAVAAVVNGEKIYKKDVLAVLEGMPLQNEEQKPEAYKYILERIVNDQLLASDAANSGLENDPEVQERFEALKTQLVNQIYLERHVEEAVTEEAVKAEYEKFKEANKGKKEIRARHILVKTEEAAKKIIEELNGGADFVDLAQQKSEDKASGVQGGDLGYFGKQDMVPAFSEAAFKLDTGKISQEPVQTQFGWHVIKVEDKRDRVVPELEKVKEAIRNKLSQQAMQELVNKLRETAEIETFDMEGNPIKLN